MNTLYASPAPPAWQTSPRYSTNKEWEELTARMQVTTCGSGAGKVGEGVVARQIYGRQSYLFLRQHDFSYTVSYALRIPEGMASHAEQPTYTHVSTIHNIFVISRYRPNSVLADMLTTPHIISQGPITPCMWFKSGHDSFLPHLFNSRSKYYISASCCIEVPLLVYYRFRL
jgi:hypothetical protein